MQAYSLINAIKDPTELDKLYSALEEYGATTLMAGLKAAQNDAPEQMVDTICQVIKETITQSGLNESQDGQSILLFTCDLAQSATPAAFPLLLIILQNLPNITNKEVWLALLPIALVACYNHDINSLLEVAYQDPQFATIAISVAKLLVADRQLSIQEGIEFMDKLITKIHKQPKEEVNELHHQVIDTALLSLLPMAPLECDALYSRHLTKFSLATKNLIRQIRKAQVHICTNSLKIDLANLQSIRSKGVLHLQEWIPYHDCDEDHAHHEHH